MDQNLDQNLEAINAKRTEKSIVVSPAPQVSEVPLRDCDFCGKPMEPKDAIPVDALLGTRMHAICAVRSESGQTPPGSSDHFGPWAESTSTLGSLTKRIAEEMKRSRPGTTLPQREAIAAKALTDLARPWDKWGIPVAEAIDQTAKNTEALMTEARRSPLLSPGLSVWGTPIPFKGARPLPPGSLCLVPDQSGETPRPGSCDAFDALSAEEKVEAIRDLFGRISPNAIELIRLSRLRLRARRMAATLGEIDFSWPSFSSAWKPRRPFDRERDG